MKKFQKNVVFSEVRGIVIYFGTLVKKQAKGIKKDITKENKPRGKIKSGKTKSPTMRLPSDSNTA